MKKGIISCFFRLILFILLVLAFIYFTSITKPNIKTTNTIDTSRPIVALTFDDGPNREFTKQILDILKNQNCLATFFVNGKNIPGNEKILKRMVIEGHELGNHTYNHIALPSLDVKAIKEQIEKTQLQVDKALGVHYELLFVRPPYGAYNQMVIDAIAYPIVLWSVDSKDWKTTNSKTIYTSVIENIKNLDILIMHDTSNHSVKALKKVIPKLKEQGFQFVTLSNLFEYRSEELYPHNIYR